MDIAEIKHGCLAENPRGIYIDTYFLHEWRTRQFLYFLRERNPFKSICFTVGDDHIELYDGVFVQEPETVIENKIDGDLMTLVKHGKFTVKTATVKGKMCVRNPQKPPLVVDFQLDLKDAEILQTIGFIIRGDYMHHNLCQYEFLTFDVSFTYQCDSEVISILDRETDASKKNLLKRYLVELITKDLCPMSHQFERRQLSIKQNVTEMCGNNIRHRNTLRTHNRILHAAMKTLANHIITLTNNLVEKTSKKVYLSRIYGLNSDKILKVYKGYIHILRTITFEQISEDFEEEVIISDQDGRRIIYVPVKFWELELHYAEVKGDSEVGDDEFKDKQIFSTEDSHIKIALKKNENKVEFTLLQFKINNIKPFGSNHPIDMAVDYLVSSAIEEYITSILEQALNDESLQEVALNPKVHVHVEDDRQPSLEHELEEFLQEEGQ